MNTNSNVSTSAFQSQKALAGEMLSPLHDIDSVQAGAEESVVGGRDALIELATGPALAEDVSASSGNAQLVGLLQQLERLTRRRPPRVAFKVKGRILFIEIADITTVQAVGNYVSLKHRSGSVLLRESLSSMAGKLKPFGFVRIHRSVLVNSFLVDEIQHQATGDYRLRVRDGKEYVVTRTYKDNLKDMAHLWLGSERLCS